MFIDRGARSLRLRSKEQNGSGMVKLYLNSAPSNGVGTGSYAPVYIHLTPNGVKTAVEPRTFETRGGLSSASLSAFWLRPKPHCLFHLCGARKQDVVFQMNMLM